MATEAHKHKDATIESAVAEQKKMDAEQKLKQLEADRNVPLERLLKVSGAWDEFKGTKAPATAGAES